MDKKYTTLLINLDRSHQRLTQSKQQLDNQQIAFERITAVDGSQLTAGDVEEVYSAFSSESYYKPLNAGEIGCYLSHRKAWQTIVEHQYDFAIIIEDDFLSCEQLKHAISALKTLECDWDYIKLAEHDRKRHAIYSKPLSQFNLCFYDKVPARTLAQAVSYQGALKLLENSQSITRPVDIDIQHWWEKNIIPYGLIPAPIKSNPKILSDIDSQQNRNQSKASRYKQYKQKLLFAINNYKHKRRLKSHLRQMFINQ